MYKRGLHARVAAALADTPVVPVNGVAPERQVRPHSFMKTFGNRAIAASAGTGKIWWRIATWR